MSSTNFVFLTSLTQNSHRPTIGTEGVCKKDMRQGTFVFLDNIQYSYVSNVILEYIRVN
jgi:hypothetical protein